MKKSQNIINTLLRFYEAISNKRVELFDELNSKDVKLIIGTAPGENITDRARMRFGFEAEGLKLIAGDNPIGYEEGTVGWAVDEPTFIYPDGTIFQIRLTMVMHKQAGSWKIVHGHYSVGVPDKEVGELTKRWLRK